jgi:hypothetical protein
MKVKFAVLAFPSVMYFPGNTKRFEFSEFTSFVELDIPTLFRDVSAKHWKEWLGTIEWDRIQGRKNLLLSWIPTSNDTLDHENKHVEDRLTHLWISLLISRGLDLAVERSVLLSGSGELLNGALVVKEIRSVGHFEPCLASEWLRRENLDQITGGRTSDDNFATWRNVYRFLVPSEHEGKPDKSQILFNLGALFFRTALEARWADIRVPNFIRTIESVVAVPRGRNQADTFVERLSILVGDETKTRLGMNKDGFTKYIKDLYQIRSDCVHGKPYAWTYQKQLEVDPDQFEQFVMKSDGVAELSAREVLLRVVSDSRFHQYLSDRDMLERAWSNGEFETSSVPVEGY